MLCRLIFYIKGNVGFVFIKEEFIDVRDFILVNKVVVLVKVGVIVFLDVFVLKGNIGLGFEKILFF